MLFSRQFMPYKFCGYHMHNKNETKSSVLSIEIQVKSVNVFIFKGGSTLLLYLFQTLRSIDSNQKNKNTCTYKKKKKKAEPYTSSTVLQAKQIL